MKRILMGVIALFSFALVWGQDISVSPYSAFGYGEKRFYHGASTFGMGGLSTAYASPYGTEMNFINPAANMNLRYTSFTFEGTLNASKFDDGTTDFNRSSGYISRVSLGFPMGEKMRFGFGFQPFSAIGYKTSKEGSFEDATTINRFEGDGGLNSLHAAFSYNLSPELALGLRTNYLFGNLDRTELFSVQNAQLISSYENKNRVNGFTVTGGAFYNKKIGENHRFTAGASYRLGKDVTVNQKYLLSTYQINPTNNDLPVNVDTIDSNFGKTKMKMPAHLSAGVSYGKDLKWNVGAQVDWEKNSDFNLPNSTQELNDRFRTSVGGYYIPNFNSFRSYFSRVTYRAGAFYETTPTVVNGKDIDNYGITFGFGLPIGKATDPSELNLGFELGQRGTLENDLVKESYANVKLSFTLNDNWFQKRKYD